MGSVYPWGSRRPWLDMYTGGFLARSKSSESSAACEDCTGGLPADMWLLITAQIQLTECGSIGALATVCHGTRHLSRNSEVWERLCREAFGGAGYVPCDSVLRVYRWSWLHMFRQRKSLRFDGLYYIETTKLLQGMNEGRGMKEADKDFYNPYGRFVTTFRCLRFFPCGAMFSYLCATQTPADIRKAASALRPDRARVQGDLKGALWGRYELSEGVTEDLGRADHATRISACTVLDNDSSPNSPPAQVRYTIELRMRPAPKGGGGGGGASSSRSGTDRGGGGTRGVGSNKGSGGGGGSGSGGGGGGDGGDGGGGGASSADEDEARRLDVLAEGMERRNPVLACELHRLSLRLRDKRLTAEAARRAATRLMRDMGGGGSGVGKPPGDRIRRGLEPRTPRRTPDVLTVRRWTSDYIPAMPLPLRPAWLLTADLVRAPNELLTCPAHDVFRMAQQLHLTSHTIETLMGGHLDVEPVKVADKPFAFLRF